MKGIRIMKETKDQSAVSELKIKKTKHQPHAHRCVYCGRRIKTVNGFCRLCLRNGFDGVYRITKRDNGWRWQEAWAKSHPNPTKYVNPLNGLAEWRVRNFGKFSSGNTKPDVVKRKMHLRYVEI